MKPFISIIIPTLNEEKYVPKLLEDLKNQKAKNFEVIVVDAYSDDQTIKEINKYKKSLSPKVFNVKKRDVVYQKNYGGKQAKGEYLVFIDADARVNTSLTQNLEKEIKSSKYMMYLPTMLPQGGNASDRFLFKIANYIVEASQNWSKPFITIGLMIFNRKFFNHIGGYKIASKGERNMVSEDHDIILRGIKSGVNPKFLKNVKVRFSLRRMKTEGRFAVISKYIISGFEMLLKGKRDVNLDYEMGGHVYNGKKKKNGNQLKEFLNGLKTFGFQSKD